MDEGDQLKGTLTPEKAPSTSRCSCCQTFDEKQGETTPCNRRLVPFLGLWNDYVENTSVHGVKKSADSRRFLALRLLWKAALIGFSIGLVVNLYNLLNAYSQNPFQTVVTVRPSTDLPFPAVTICNLHYLDLNKVTDLALNISNASEVISEFFARTLVVNDSENNLLEFLKEHPQIKNITYEALRKVAVPDMEDMLVLCTWNGLQEPCEAMMTSVDFERQRCFQFNADLTRPRTSRTSGKLSGLEVIINVDQDNYIFSEGLGAGVEVILHEPGTLPDIIRKGFLAPPGFTTMSSVLLREHKYLPAPYRAFTGETCVENIHDEEVTSALRQYGLRYTHSLCRLLCLQLVTQEECGCRLSEYSFYDSRKTDRPFCSLIEIFSCVAASQNRLARDLNDSVCECNRLCQGKEYDVTTSMAYFPSESAIKLLQRVHETVSQTDLRKNVVDLKVFFGDLVSQEVTHVPQHSLESVLSSVGGQMGLFMGASLLSLMEVLELCARLSWQGAQVVYWRIRSRREAGASN